MTHERHIQTVCLLAVVPVCVVVRPSLAQVQAGTRHKVHVQTPTRYAGAPVSGQVESRWAYTLTHPEATYIAVHFEAFDLGPQDYLQLRDGHGNQRYTLSGRGKLQAGTFWSRHIRGPSVVLELFVSGAEGGQGFQIDEYAAGFVDLGAPPVPESVHGPDDRTNAACHQTLHPEMYARGRAVARLLIGGIWLCTGSVVSPYNHVLTNDHCIQTAQAAIDTDFEFMAEAPACASENCSLCWPGVVFSGGALLQADAGLDYAMVRLNDDAPAAMYGHLEFDNRPPQLGEQIYIPQHPDGRAKEFAVFSTHPADTGGVARVQSVNEVPCLEGSTQPEVGYHADTEGGSSGSPVLAASTHKLIALHHCGGDLNLGIPIHLIYPRVRNDVLGLHEPGRIGPGAISVSADSAQPGQPADLAVDADLTTQWTSGNQPGPHWLQLDLGWSAPVSGFKVWHTGAGGGSEAQNTRAFLVQSAPSAAGPWTTESAVENLAQANVSEISFPAPRTLRHVRIEITDPGNENLARIREFEVVSTSPMTGGIPVGTNIAPESKAVQASSTYGPEWGPQKAIDGVISEASKWVSADIAPPHFLVLDLGAWRTVSGFVLRQPSAAGEPSFLNLTWFSVQSGRSISGPWFAETQVRTSGAADYEAHRFIAPKDLRYIRLRVDDAGADRIARVPEFEVFTHAGPSARFDALPTIGYAPLQVAFTDRSTGALTAWTWAFGDGATGSGPKPVHTYDRPGAFTVSLTVVGPEGSDTFVAADLIQVQTVRADFDADGDVDQSDFGIFQKCFTGSGIIQTGALCLNARLDDDEDVDQDDLEVFRGCMSGANVPANPGCDDSGRP